MSDDALILVLNRNPANLRLLGTFLEEHGFRTGRASSLAEMDDVLDRATDLRLAMLDLTGFDETLWRRCERLRDMNVPFLLISAAGSDAGHGLRHGAHGILTRPLVKQRLHALVNSFLG